MCTRKLTKILQEKKIHRDPTDDDPISLKPRTKSVGRSTACMRIRNEIAGQTRSWPNGFQNAKRHYKGIQFRLLILILKNIVVFLSWLSRLMLLICFGCSLSKAGLQNLFCFLNGSVCCHLLGFLNVLLRSHFA